MNELLNFVKEMFMITQPEKTPIGLCSFEHTNTLHKKPERKPKQKRELRLSELMDK